MDGPRADLKLTRKCFGVPATWAHDAVQHAKKPAQPFSLPHTPFSVGASKDVVFSLLRHNPETYGRQLPAMGRFVYCRFSAASRKARHSFGCPTAGGDIGHKRSRHRTNAEVVRELQKNQWRGSAFIKEMNRRLADKGLGLLRVFLVESKACGYEDCVGDTMKDNGVVRAVFGPEDR